MNKCYNYYTLIVLLLTSFLNLNAQERITMDTNIGLSFKERKGIARFYNVLLSDEHVFYIKLRNYHWNVKGPAFDQFHKFFETIYQDIENVIDVIAERSQALGFKALGSMAEFLEHSRLKEDRSTNNPSDLEMVKHILNDIESIIRFIRSSLASDITFDDGSENFLQDLIEKHEKTAWMLRSFLQQEHSANSLAEDNNN